MLLSLSFLFPLIPGYLSTHKYQKLPQTLEYPFFDRTNFLVNVLFDSCATNKTIPAQDSTTASQCGQKTIPLPGEVLLLPLLLWLGSGNMIYVSRISCYNPSAPPQSNKRKIFFLACVLKYNWIQHLWWLCHYVLTDHTIFPCFFIRLKEKN